MGLFDQLNATLLNNSSKEEKLQIRAEKREQDFVKQRDIFNAGMQEEQADVYAQANRSDLIRWQQELDDELFNTVQTLLGRTAVDDRLIQVSDPLCNKTFIHEVIIPQCKPFMSRNMINSNLDERRILMLLRSTCDDIVDAMADGHDRYGISFENFDLVLRLVKNTIQPGTFRALRGWTKKMDSTMVKRIESENVSTNEKKRSLMGAN